MQVSVGTTGNSYDNALAESIIGLFKTEVIHQRWPMTQHGCGRVRNRRLLGPIGDVPPAEFEQEYYRQQQSQATAA